MHHRRVRVILGEQSDTVDSSLKRQGATKHDVMWKTLTPLLLLLSIPGKRQSKVRKGSVSVNEDVFSTHCMSWSTRSRCLTSMGWRYFSSMSTLRLVFRLRWWKPKSRSTRLLRTPSRHSRKGMIARGRTLSTYLIGGSQTVQRYQHSHFMLRAVLTNSPNSCPPDRLFSIFNTTYNDDRHCKLYLRGKGRNGWGGWETTTCMKFPFSHTVMDLEFD